MHEIGIVILGILDIGNMRKKRNVPFSLCSGEGKAKRKKCRSWILWR